MSDIKPSNRIIELLVTPLENKIKSLTSQLEKAEKEKEEIIKTIRYCANECCLLCEGHIIEELDKTARGYFKNKEGKW